MIWMNARESAAATVKYFTEEAQLDYYSEGQQIIGNWGGKGAERLGLSGRLDNDDFVALCKNINPDTGEHLTPRTKVERTCAYDITFDCPKSVSVMYAWTGDRRIEERFYRAARETMADAEQEMRTRVRLGGNEDGDRLTKEMVWAEFPHFTARPVDGVPDPHLHMHCVVMNATFDGEEGRWKAGQFREVKRRMPYYEAMFHTRLSNYLQEIGYEIRKSGKAFEIEGVPETVLRKFSRRTAVINEKQTELGITDKDEAAKIGAMTREKKDTSLTMEELREVYRTMVTPEEAAVLDEFRQPRLKERLGERRQPDARLAEHLEELTPEGRKSLRKSATNAPTERSAFSSPEVGYGKTAQSPGPVVPEGASVARAAIDYSIAHNFHLASVVSEENILEHAFRWAVGSGLKPEEIRQAMRSHPDLIFGKMGDQRLVTTHTIHADEQELVAWVRNGKGTMQPLVTGHKIGDKRLNKEQRAAVEHALTSTDRVTAIDGRAGTGKTVLMREAVAAMKENHHKVLVVAPTSSAVSRTLREHFPEAQTVEQLLVNEKLQEEYRGGTWWVDEAGQLSGPTMTRLVNLAEKMGARIHLTGDVYQHRAVERGDALRLLYEQADLKPAVVTEIVRQKGKYKAIMEHLTRGEVYEGYKMMDKAGLVHELPRFKRYETIANIYVKEANEGVRPLVVAPAHAEGKLVTNAIRERMKADGDLRHEHAVTMLKPVHMSPAQKMDYRSYRPGQIVELITGTEGSPAGTRMVVDSIDPEVGNVYVRKPESATRTGIRNLSLKEYAHHFEVFEGEELLLGKGERIRITMNGKTANRNDRVHNSDQHTVIGFDEHGDIKLDNGLVLPKDFGHLDYGYYSTSYAAQSMTVQRVLIAESAESFGAASREQLNVSATRGRIRGDLYTNNKRELLTAVEPSSARPSATDLVLANEKRLSAEVSQESEKTLAREERRHRSAEWLQPVAQGDLGFGPPIYALLSAITVGMIVSCFRWLIVDHVLEWTGVPKSVRGYENMPDKLDAVDYVIAMHYRYYQFYANTLVATIWAYLLNRFMETLPLLGWGTDLGVLILCAGLLAGSRDTLTKYRQKMAVILSSVAEKGSLGDPMTNGMDHHGGGATPSKPRPESKPETKAVTPVKPVDAKSKGGAASK